MTHRVYYLVALRVKRNVWQSCGMARDDLHFRLRIPEALKAQVEEAAAANNRSLTAEIISRLEKSFEIEPKWDEMVENVADLLDQMGEIRGRVDYLEGEIRSIGEAAGVRDPNYWKD